MADMSPMAEELDANHNDSHHSPANSVGSTGSTGGNSVGIPMLVVHKREIVTIMDEHHDQNNHHMDEDDQHGAIDDQDTDGDALSPQKRPLNNNNNDVATVFLIDASDVDGAHDGHDTDQAVEEVSIAPFEFGGSARAREKCHQLFRMV